MSTVPGLQCHRAQSMQALNSCKRSADTQNWAKTFFHQELQSPIAGFGLYGQTASFGSCIVLPKSSSASSAAYLSVRGLLLGFVGAKFLCLCEEPIVNIRSGPWYMSCRGRYASLRRSSCSLSSLSTTSFHTIGL